MFRTVVLSALSLVYFVLSFLGLSLIADTMILRFILATTGFRNFNIADSSQKTDQPHVKSLYDKNAKNLVLLNSSSSFDVLMIRYLFRGKEVYRFDYSNKVRAPASGRIVISKVKGTGVFETLDSLLPVELAPTEGVHQTLEEAFSTPGTKFLLYEVNSRLNREQELIIMVS